MRRTPRYLMSDPDEVKRLVRAHPWATFVSPTSAGLVASHYPVLLDEETDGITISADRTTRRTSSAGTRSSSSSRAPTTTSPRAGTRRVTSSGRGTT